MPLFESILSRRLQRPVHVGETLLVQPDHALTDDALGGQVLRGLLEEGGQPDFPPSRVVATCGRNFPSRDVESANAFRAYRDLVDGFDARFLGPSRAGVPHNVLAENIELSPGEILAGTDSHTLAAGAFGVLSVAVGVEEMIVVLKHGQLWVQVPPTIKVVLRGELPWPSTTRDSMLAFMARYGGRSLVGKCLEFWDETEGGLSTDAKTTYTSWSAECGVTTAFFSTPELERTAGAAAREGYERTITLNLGDVTQPLVAWPHDPFDIHTLDESSGTPITHCFLGTCSGEGLTGLLDAAAVLSGRAVDPRVTFIVSPQSQSVAAGAAQAGALEVFARAGAVVTTPTCGACLASHSGVLADGETCVSTGNRNYKGRMGAAGARIYLASARVAALSAVLGQFPTAGDFER